MISKHHIDWHIIEEIERKLHKALKMNEGIEQIDELHTIQTMLYMWVRIQKQLHMLQEKYPMRYWYWTRLDREPEVPIKKGDTIYSCGCVFRGKKLIHRAIVVYTKEEPCREHKEE